ncbi:MAG: phosphoribosylformylglycinamidine synthase subunit PurL [Caldilineaceae bacterium]|nr:phosphoribosylformylglycinamidine synthase subunit PurL [Caldilineaceae bacterium]
MTVRIEVRGAHAATTRGILRNAVALGINELRACTVSRLYFLEENPGAELLQQLCTFLLADPVTESASWDVRPADKGVHVIEVAPRPGVTDVAARELRRGMQEIGLPDCDVTTGTRYELTGDLTDAKLHLLAEKLLCNATIQHFRIGPIFPQFGAEVVGSGLVEEVPLTRATDDELLTISRERLLSLDLHEMHAIRDFYIDAGREPTDVELETLAQTWSEHCVHKTFRARINFTHEDADGAVISRVEIDGLLNQYIRAATEAVYPEWLYSAFVDDAGIIAFDERYDLAFKVETHNHPSALEPFGGANTGVGGVVRDILGVSARPIACTDVLCFGPQDFPHAELPPGILHPRRIAEGVVAGVGDYGNKLGLPTVNGAVLYDAGYLGNPLVFCGCAGLLPHGAHPTAARAGDLVVALGGGTGRDGIHGATFSSAELTHETGKTAGSAVQIGDPITEKGLIELIEAARDEQLYTAITDCGAGGFSSSIGEMGEELGVDIELTNVTLKYPGLTPWEIWLSEAQERLVIAVPPAGLARLQELAARWDVDVSVLGRFTGDRQLVVRYADHIVADLPMGFLHDGLPRRKMEAVYTEKKIEDWKIEDWVSGNGWSDKTFTPSSLQSSIFNYENLLLALLRHPSVASKESIVRTYDHEVRGGTLVRPFTGPGMDGPTDAAVLKPLGTWAHDDAFVLSNGINPRLGLCDPYAMAVSVIDEAVRNAVAVGADPDRIAILDNFCWGNPTYPDRLGALVRTCQGCYDGAVAYGTPFISGKDSLYNEFNGKPIPGTLLISAIAIAPEMSKVVTSDLKTPGNRLYLLGETRAELGGSLLFAHLGLEGGIAPAMPADPLTRYRALHGAIRGGLVQSCHDLSEGGLGVALAEMCIGGRLGAEIEIERLKIEDWIHKLSPWHKEDADNGSLPSNLQSSIFNLLSLFSESNGRLLVEVAPEDGDAFEERFGDDVALALIGEVVDAPYLSIRSGGQALTQLPIETMLGAWSGEIQWRGQHDRES